jgi:hypothetical protein
MMTKEDLTSRTVRDLAALAKKQKVPGWHSMNKSELVAAILRRVKARQRRAAAATDGNGHPPRRRPVPKELVELQAKMHESKDLAFRSLVDANGQEKDRLVVMVRDSYWLHAYWELSRKGIERAKAALGQYWHGAKPVLRLYRVIREGAATPSRHLLRDVEIHGGVNNWYLDVQNPPDTFQLEIGYLTLEGKFYCLGRSNVVATPPATAGDAFDRNWAEVAKDYERIFALSGGYSQPEANGDLRAVFEERLQRPIGDAPSVQFGPGAAVLANPGGCFDFHVDTELIVHGTTHPDAHVTLRGEPVRLRSDGSFAVRLNLPDRRHVLPMVASSRDGAEQRTIVLAIDRNTKVMEPVSHESAE